jgi:hypothetical protein
MFYRHEHATRRLAMPAPHPFGAAVKRLCSRSLPALLAWTAAACGGPDPEPASDPRPPAAAPPGGDAAPDDRSAREAGSDDPAPAKATLMCGSEPVDPADACIGCVARRCPGQALACCNQPGCIDVVRCAQKHKCSSIDCFQPDKCKKEIDAAGIDVALEHAKPLGECAALHCSAECDLPTK